MNLSDRVADSNLCLAAAWESARVIQKANFRLIRAVNRAKQNGDWGTVREVIALDVVPIVSALPVDLFVERMTTDVGLPNEQRALCYVGNSL